MNQELVIVAMEELGAIDAVVLIINRSEMKDHCVWFEKY